VRNLKLHNLPQHPFFCNSMFPRKIHITKLRDPTTTICYTHFLYTDATLHKAQHFTFHKIQVSPHAMKTYMGHGTKALYIYITIKSRCALNFMFWAHSHPFIRGQDELQSHSGQGSEDKNQSTCQESNHSHVVKSLSS
jgi:hypothetical protein